MLIETNYCQGVDKWKMKELLKSLHFSYGSGRKKEKLSIIKRIMIMLGNQSANYKMRVWRMSCDYPKLVEMSGNQDVEEGSDQLQINEMLDICFVCEDYQKIMKKAGSSDEDYEESVSQHSEFQMELGHDSNSSDKVHQKKKKPRQPIKINDWQYQREVRPKRPTNSKLPFQDSSDSEQIEESTPQESIFEPEIEQILWRRQNEQESQYYVKFKNHSYLWCEWLTEQQILNDKSGKQKINRFNRMHDKKLQELDPDDDIQYFDPSYLEIDRIIFTTELFPIIHPKKANEIKNKWNEYLTIVISKLLNFYISKIKYGVYFMQPVNPEADGCPDYRKVITSPMDLGTIFNRLHLDYYKTSQQFWYELGLVFKNCRTFNTDPSSEIRRLGDTLGEVSLKLYEQWHAYQLKRYSEEEQAGSSEAQGWNPGNLSYEWFNDSQDFVPSFAYTGDSTYDLHGSHEQLYYVKWKNLSYLNATWEVIKDLANSQAKLIEFRQFNRALDKDNRALSTKNSQKHRMIQDYEQKKKSRMSVSDIQDLRKQLYQLDIGINRKPFQYTPRTQTIYKDRKLLRDYQLESLNWMIDAYYCNRNVLLADEMGLGKTIQSIAFLNHLYNIEQCRGPFLIIAPLSTLQHWKRSCEEWTTLNAVLYYDHQGQNGRREMRNYEWYYTDISMKGNMLNNQDLIKFQILITSYEVFNQDHATVIQNIPFQFIVVDEAHRLKNQNAKILASLRKLICSRIMILTGTPVQNNPDELWSLLNFIEPTKFPSLNNFKKEFGDLMSAEQIEKLNKSLKPYILRRQKEDVEQSIPPLQENIIDVELTNIQKTLYRALYERNKTALIQGFSQQTAQIASLNNLDMHLRKLCNHPLLLKEMHNEMQQKLQQDGAEYHKILIEWSGKMVLLDKMLSKFLKEDKKVLIFSQFTNMLALLEEYLKHNNIRYEKITGDIKSIDRQNSIDRFNDLKKGRQVFLLSTKAGGQGINLTAAEIVVIFDSDWNPQNDIQATARAHRIGQDKQVAVYRLITKNTYEAKMFERAIAKLGLDQAIFLGGEFKQIANATEQQQQKKLNKKEMEILLKQGSLGLLQQSGQEVLEMNIDEILNNTRVAKYSLINGSYTISKRTFVPEQSTLKVNIDDPNFWQVVLKNHQSRSQKLLKSIQDENNIKTTIQQKIIMTELAECINNLIEAKLSMQGYDADEEVALNDILNMIGFSKIFDKSYKDLVNIWIDEMNRPSRRFKKITLTDLDLKNSPIQQSEIQIEQQQPKQVEFNWSEYEEYKKLLTKSQSDLSVKLCTICEKPRCNIFCRGFCKRSYHADCLELPPMDENTIDIKYLCEDCSKFRGNCFVCQKSGSFYPNQNKRRITKLQDQEFLDYQFDDSQQEYIVGKRTTRSRVKQSQSELLKCNVPNCHKLYHFACVETSRNFKIMDGVTQKFKCSLHYCDKCKEPQEEGQTMFQCLRCPKSYHPKCAPKGIQKKTKKFILCPSHREETIQPIIKKKVKIEQQKKNKKDTNSSDLNY